MKHKGIKNRNNSLRFEFEFEFELEIETEIVSSSDKLNYLG